MEDSFPVHIAGMLLSDSMPLLLWLIIAGPALAQLRKSESELENAISKVLNQIDLGSSDEESELEKEYSRLYYEMQDLQKEIQVLAPQGVEEAYVWLHRRL